jgi:ABC-type nitrate/sulfonate/bicarbonate transport system substrate-binding protein
MAKFVIAPHMRLHEWLAEEKGYFRDAGLDYEFQNGLAGEGNRLHDLGDRIGAYQTYERGRTCDVSSACHWTVNIAAAAGHGRIYVDAYSVSPCGIFVPPDSDIRRPEDLAGVPISVGFQSGSHYSTIEALDRFLRPDRIELSFADGLLFRRMEKLFDRQVAAASLFSGPYYFMEQLGFRKILDTSFMMASMVGEHADMDDVKKYFTALRRAQSDIDLHPHRYTDYYRNEFPDRFRPLMDTRMFGPGERIVFEPYTRKMYEEAQAWTIERGIFQEQNPITRDYAHSTARGGAEGDRR